MSYCHECAKHLAEPKDLVTELLIEVGGASELAEWATKITVYDNGKYISISEYDLKRGES